MQGQHGRPYEITASPLARSSGRRLSRFGSAMYCPQPTTKPWSCCQRQTPPTFTLHRLVGRLLADRNSASRLLLLVVRRLSGTLRPAYLPKSTRVPRKVIPEHVVSELGYLPGREMPLEECEGLTSRRGILLDNRLVLQLELCCLFRSRSGDLQQPRRFAGIQYGGVGWPLEWIFLSR